MKVLRLSAAAALALATGIVTQASGPIAVYAKVERVVMEPNEQAPERIQVWGAFSIAGKSNPNDFTPPVSGYLYYRLPDRNDDRPTARTEWTDLKNVAGTNKLVAFGGQWMGVPTVRNTDALPQSPDLFTLNTGIQKISDRATFPPIKALRDFKR